MNKTIIAIYGRKDEGKSETIKNVCQKILIEFENAKPSIDKINYSYDILLSIEIGNIKIGIESQGDPNSRMLKNDTIRQLADKKVNNELGDCDIIICATRTSGKTVRKVDEIADEYDYHTLWISSFYSPKLNHNLLNDFASDNIIRIIKSLINENL